MTDLVRLGFSADTRGLMGAQRELDKTTAAGGRLDRSTRSVTTSMTRMAGALGGVVAVVGGATKLVATSRQFDVLNAQLVTATGSASNASVAFDAISKFAARTPYDLAQATESFTKLVNLGLTPSERALVSYGNTASAMGKSLNQFIEAVADASTNEFERLKEFGIKSKQQGDNVIFTFRGVSTTVKKEASAIEGYLTALGENDFAGSMANRMSTLDGRISNLGDSWDMLFLNISKAGVGDLMLDGVNAALGAVNGLNDFLQSGQLDQSISVLGAKFSGFTSDIQGAFNYITNLFAIGTDLWGDDVSKFIDFMRDALVNMPENFRAAIQLSAVEIAALVDYAAAYGEAFAEVLGVKLAQAVEAAKVYGIAIGEALNPFSDGGSNLDSELERLAETAISMTDEIFSNAERKASIATNARRESISQILIERDAAVSASNVQIDKLGELGRAYELSKKARADDHTDQLAAFKVGADGSASQIDDIEKLISKVDEFGGAWSNTGSIIADAFGNAVSILDDFSSKMNGINELQAELNDKRKDYADGTSEAMKIDKSLAKLQGESSSAQIGALGKTIGLSASLFKENSKERKALHALEMGFMAIEIALATEKAIVSAVSAVATQGSGDPYSAFGRIAAMIGIMAGVLGAAGIAFSGGGGGGYEAPQEGGTGTVLGDATAQSESLVNVFDDFEDIQIDQLAELRGIRTALTGLSGGIERLASQFSSTLDFGDSGYQGQLGTIKSSKNSPLMKVGEIAANSSGLTNWLYDQIGDPLFDAIVGGFSKTSKKLIDSGINFLSQSLGDIIESGDISAEMFQAVETTKKKFWGLSKKKTTAIEATGLDSAIRNQMADIFGFITDSVISAATSLGVDADFDALLERFKIDIGSVSFKDKTGDEIQKELEAIFSQQADLISQFLVPEMLDFQKVGEGAFETLQRVAYEQAVFNDSLERTGMSLKDLSYVLQIDVAQSIIGLLGSAERFSELSNDYFAAFYTDAEQMAYLESSISDVFSSLGLGMVSTREGFRALVEGLNLTDEADQKLYATLLELSPAMDKYLKGLEDENEARKKLRIDFLQEEKSIMQNSLSGISSLVNSINAELGQAFSIQEALAAARLGDFDVAMKMTRERVSASSFTDPVAFARAQAVEANRLFQIGELAGDKKSELERQIELLDMQIEAIKNGAELVTNAIIDLTTTVSARDIEIGDRPDDQLYQIKKDIAETNSRNAKAQEQADIMNREIVKNTKTTAKILQRIELDGVRTRK